MISLGNLHQKIKDYLDQRLSFQICTAEKKLQEVIVANLLCLLCRGSQFDKLILVLPSSKDCYFWYDFALFYKKSIHDFSFNLEWLDHLSLYGRERFLNKTESKYNRLSSLFALQSDEKAFVVTSLQSLLQKGITREKLRKNTIILRKGMKLSQENFFKKLNTIGYHSVSSLYSKASYSCRGGVVDVYSVHSRNPIRVEFFGDKIFSIRTFSTEDQRSLEQVDSSKIVPATDFIYSREEKQEKLQVLHELFLGQNIDRCEIDSITNDFLQDSVVGDLDALLPAIERNLVDSRDFIVDRCLYVFPKSIQSCIESFNKYMTDQSQLLEKSVELGHPVVSLKEHFSPVVNFFNFIDNSLFIEMGNPFTYKNFDRIVLENNFNLSNHLNCEELGSTLDWWLDCLRLDFFLQKKIIFLVASKADEESLVNILRSRNVGCSIIPDIQFDFTKPLVFCETGVFIGYGYLDDYIYDQDDHVLLIPSHLLFKNKNEVKSCGEKQTVELSLHEIKKGDYLVHKNHGVGRFSDIVKLLVDEIEKDFIKIEYQQSNYIYLPVDKLHLINKFHQGNKSTCLDKLGGKSWINKKSRIKRKIQDIAEDLIKLQAKRKVLKGPSFGPTSSLYYELVDDFPYQETDDQVTSLFEIEKDLRATYPMDRLLIGDVGFGKTEIAIRVAMRSVLEGYQVIMLVPTAVLSYQHYISFKERLDKFGVVVSYLNGRLKSSEKDNIISHYNEGKIDVLIGTHLILSQKLLPKRLGLILVDEEHKFGVVHKEKIKEMSASCNLLTMTATPLPRTLNMSLFGLKDVLVLKTPPKGRRSIKTIISEFNEKLIKEAIQKEIQRKGQIFFVHNNISELAGIKLLLEKLVEGLKVLVVHGQMSEEFGSQLLMSFVERKYHVLLCTTVIESGIDIPNANTMIVNMAENYGLSQMHQLRGRVGRSTVQAYAYFLCKDQTRLADTAKKRLEVIQSLQAVGSGRQIATHDMEIRGVGNLLGVEQAGEISTVGVDLYVGMLEEAINKMKQGNNHQAVVEPEIKLLSSMKIEPVYISDESERLSVYRKIFFASTRQEIATVLGEVEDKYGMLPDDLRCIACVSFLKTLLSVICVTQLHEVKKGYHYELTFGVLDRKLRVFILKLVKENSKHYRLDSSGKLMIFLEKTSIEPYHSKLATLAAFVEPCYMLSSQNTN